jgi:N-formylglutamate amidohydrolase
VADEGYLVVVPARATVEVLNPVGGTIYAMLDGQHTRDDIVRSVVEEFDVDESQARRDLDAFLEELAARKMLVQGNGGGAGEDRDG